MCLSRVYFKVYFEIDVLILKLTNQTQKLQYILKYCQTTLKISNKILNRCI